MSVYLPPGLVFPPPSPQSPSPPVRPWWPPPPTGSGPTSPGGVVAGVAISVGTFLLVLAFICSLCKGQRQRRAEAEAEAAAAAAALASWQWQHQRRAEAEAATAAAVLASLQWSPPSSAPPEPRPQPRGATTPAPEEVRRPQPRRDDAGRPAAASLPSFTYSRTVRHNNAQPGGEDAAAATCSVCLGEFQAGETVRLLPVCLHLYHVECIDPWLEAHSTCPLCRTGTDPATTIAGLLPPV